MIAARSTSVIAGPSNAPAQQWQDVAVPRTLPAVRPVFSRRQVLAGGAALAVFGMTGSACSSPPAAAGGRRTRIAVETGPARQRAGHRGGCGRSHAGECSADRSRRRTRPTCAGVGHRDRPPRRQSDIHLQSDHQPDTHHVSRGGAPTVTVRRDQFLARVRGQRQSLGDHVFGLSGGPARLDRRRVHGLLQRCAGVRRIGVMTSAEPSGHNTPPTPRCALP